MDTPYETKTGGTKFYSLVSVLRVYTTRPSKMVIATSGSANRAVGAAKMSCVKMTRSAFERPLAVFVERRPRRLPRIGIDGLRQRSFLAGGELDALPGLIP